MRILFCGISGFPSNRQASVNRYSAIAKTMESNNEIIFINRIPIYNKEDLESNFDFKVIDATGTKYRPKSFFKRNFIKTFSPLAELFTIKRLNKESNVDWLNVYTDSFFLSINYYIISKLFGIKTILHYVEKRSDIETNNLYKRANFYLLDKYSIKFFDKIIPISTVLDTYLKDKKVKVPTLVIPSICDFKFIESIKYTKEKKEDFFLFCSSTAYEEVISFVIDSYLKINTNKVKLYLVLNGPLSEALSSRIKTNNDSIELYKNLDYSDLISLYKNAKALLIPLRNTIQDKARFPQKICEYIASKGIVITTRIGDVSNYFENEKNTLIASQYSTADFSEKMEWVLLNESKLIDIKEESYRNGLNYFNTSSYNDVIAEFLSLD